MNVRRLVRIGVALLGVALAAVVVVAYQRSGTPGRDVSRIVTISGSAPIGGFELHRQEHRSAPLFAALPAKVPSTDVNCANSASSHGTLTFTFDDGSTIGYGVCDALPAPLADLWQQGNTISANTGPQCAQVFPLRAKDSAVTYEMPAYLSGCFRDDLLIKDVAVRCTDGRLLVAHDDPHAWAFVDSFLHVTSTPAADDPGYKSALETCRGS